MTRHDAGKRGLVVIFASFLAAAGVADTPVVGQDAPPVETRRAAILATRDQVYTLHVLARRRGAELPAILAQRYGVSSARQLTMAQAGELIGRLKRGNTGRISQPHNPNNRVSAASDNLNTWLRGPLNLIFGL